MGWPIRGYRCTCSRRRRTSWDCAWWLRIVPAQAGRILVVCGGWPIGLRMPCWCWTRWEPTQRRCWGSRRAGRSRRRARPGWPAGSAASRWSPRSARRAGRLAGWRPGNGCRCRSPGTLPGSAAGFSAAWRRWRAAPRGCSSGWPQRAARHRPPRARPAWPARLFPGQLLRGIPPRQLGSCPGPAAAHPALGLRTWFHPGADGGPPRGRGHHGPAPARPVVRRCDTGRAAPAPPGPWPLLDRRRRPGDARTARRIAADPPTATQVGLRALAVFWPWQHRGWGALAGRRASTDSGIVRSKICRNMDLGRSGSSLVLPVRRRAGPARRRPEGLRVAVGRRGD
jgi:hypothetical protein